MRPIIATVDGNPSVDEVKRLKSWLSNLLGGIKNAFEWFIFRKGRFEFHQIGDGLDQLRDVELTKQKREDISQALGIPYVKLFPHEASGLGGAGVADGSDIDFYKETIVPRCEFIQDQLNVQLFGLKGLELRFNPNSLDVFQEDENARSESVARVTQAVETNPKAFQLGAMVLGMEIPDEAQAILDEIIADKEAAREEFAANIERADNDDEGEIDPDDEELPSTLPRNDDGLRSVLAGWHSWALRRVEKGKTKTETFTPRDCEIPPALYNSIAAQIKAAETKQDINTVFRSIFQQLNFSSGADVKALTEQVQSLTELVQANSWSMYP